MNLFVLDPQLKTDCYQLGESTNSYLLLNKNSLVRWFILVPKTHEIDFTDLPIRVQSTLLTEINLIASFIKKNFSHTKLNIATIGNVVSQLHIHIVSRQVDDYCWPNVVWGNSQFSNYQNTQLDTIYGLVKSELGDKFS